jgi:Zn-dependent peptidase ImmA (M78 family)
MAVRRKQIRDLVETLLTRHRITRAPVPVDRIARELGIHIKLDKVDADLSGFIVRDKGRRVLIGANKSHHPNRQRFTIAHELGHYFLHAGYNVHLDEGRAAFTVNLRNSKSSKGEDNDEREANLFAAELLMPAKFLRDDLQGEELDLLVDNKFLSELAKKYSVSLQALTFRLTHLGYIAE